MTAIAHEPMPGEIAFPDMRKERGAVASDETVAYRPAWRKDTAWPLTSSLEVLAFPAEVRTARRHARAAALGFGLPALADTVELVVSEIVTNAVLATSPLCDGGLATPVVRLWLGSDLRCVLIRVWDVSSEMPAPREAGPDDDSGRGLMLVDCLASEWGAYRKENGKVVWVILG